MTTTTAPALAKGGTIKLDISRLEQERNLHILYMKSYLYMKKENKTKQQQKKKTKKKISGAMIMAFLVRARLFGRTATISILTTVESQ